MTHESTPILISDGLIFTKPTVQHTGTSQPPQTPGLPRPMPSGESVSPAHRHQGIATALVKHLQALLAAPFTAPAAASTVEEKHHG